MGGGFWIAAGWYGTRRSGISAALRGGAIIASLLVPLPVFARTVGAQWFAYIPSSVGRPIFAILCSSAPLVLWTLAFNSKHRRRNSGPFLVMEWNHYDSTAPAGSIPPRTSSFRRAV